MFFRFWLTWDHRGAIISKLLFLVQLVFNQNIYGASILYDEPPWVVCVIVNQTVILSWSRPVDRSFFALMC